MTIRAATDISVDVKNASNTSAAADGTRNTSDNGGSSSSSSNINITVDDNGGSENGQGMSIGVTVGIAVCAVLLLVVGVIGMRMCSHTTDDNDDKEVHDRGNVVTNGGYSGPSPASSTDPMPAEQQTQQQEQQSTSTADPTLAAIAAARPGELIYVVASPDAACAQVDDAGSGANTSAAPVYSSFVGNRNKGGGSGGGGPQQNEYDVLDATRGRATTAPSSLPSHDNYSGYTVSSGPGEGATPAIVYAIPMEYAVPATSYAVNTDAFC